MSEIISMDLLFVNGINTSFPCSGVQALKGWENSFRRKGISFETLSTAPKFGMQSQNKLYWILLGIFYFPGTLFRIFKFPISEFLYKLSPFLVLQFILIILRKKIRHVIFSHHAIFFLMFFCRKSKRVLLIHDLISIRSRSFGASRRLQRFYLRIELIFYKFSPVILIQSYQECRILRRFLSSEIHLIRCHDLEFDSFDLKLTSGLALISDWRRHENFHGASQFFSTPIISKYTEKSLFVRFYGFGSNKIFEHINADINSKNLLFSDGGTFKDVAEIEEGYFFVPIYHGAGIKRKTLEALSFGRFVVGTKAAFIGLPPWIISDVTKRVNSVNDLVALPFIPDAKVFEKKLSELAKYFHDISDIIY